MGECPTPCKTGGELSRMGMSSREICPEGICPDPQNVMSGRQSADCLAVSLVSQELVWTFAVRYETKPAMISHCTNDVISRTAQQTH